MDDPRRKDDVSIDVLNRQFMDFMDRYDRDWAATQAWRDKHDKMLSDHKDMFADIMPNYRRGMWIASIILLTSIGFVVNALWKHFSWK